MIDADINDIAIEIPEESKTIEKPDGAPSTSGEKSIQRRKTSNTAMDIYSELKSKREEELLKIIDEKISKITVLEQKIIKLEEAQKETSDKEQERGKKKRKLAENCNEDSTMNKNLQDQVENLTNMLSERENELHEVREKLAESEWNESTENNRLKKEIEELKKKDNESTEIKRLKNEIEELKKKDNKENNNIQLKALQKVIDTKDKDLQNLQRVNERLSSKQNEKVSNADISNSTNTTNELMKMIEERMHCGFNSIQENMEKFIKDKLVEIKDPDTTMEDVPELPSPIEQRRSYANVASRSADSQNFRNIMLATKNEELVEQSAKRQRAKNLIIHGKEEQTPEEDSLFVREMLKELQIGAITAKQIERIGAADPNKGRPIKIVFNNEDEQQKVFLNLRNLKGMNLYKKISIREDYTFTERSLVKDFIQQAKLKNQEEDIKNSNIIWRVRGTPKNGLTLKKFTRDLKEINPPQN